MTMNLDILLAQSADFAQRLEAELDRLDMLTVCRTLEMDHICLRLDAASDVWAIKAQLEQIGNTISTAVINRREIYIIELHEPMQVGMWQTTAVELPHPKPGSPYVNGWEHVEFVLPQTGNTLLTVRSTFEALFPHLQQSRYAEMYQRKDDEPIADNDQLPNPTVAIKTGRLSVKFHAHPIQSVVGYRKSSHSAE